jgi:hypothetical protein
MSSQCGLCRQQKPLKRSHLLSAGLFKAVAQGHAPYDSAPIMMDIRRGTAVQSNDQARKPFLCGDCEQRFSARGESKVIAQCHRKDGEFLLCHALKAAPPSHVSSGRSIYYGDRLPAEVSAEAFQYFLLSIIWRASATDWPSSTGVVRGALGPYEEDVRRYLLGDFPVPDVVSISVYVNFEPNPTVLLAYPTISKTQLLGLRLRQHNLHIPGIRFIALVGRNVRKLNVGELQGSSGLPTFIEWWPTGTEFHHRLVRDVSGLQSKGKLATS